MRQIIGRQSGLIPPSLACILSWSRGSRLLNVVLCYFDMCPLFFENLFLMLVLALWLKRTWAYFSGNVRAFHIQLVPWNQAWEEYLHHGNWQMS